MKKQALKLFTVSICALFMLLSAEVSFAQKNWKKAVKGAKNARTSSTRKLSTKGKTKLPTQTPPVDVSNIKKPVVVQSMTNAPVNAAVEAAQKAAKKPATSSIPVPVKELLPTSTVSHDNGTNLTGTQVLATYFPTWRQELGEMFNKEQLDAVEKAFAATDDFIFVRRADGELTVRNKDEWDYEARFLTILKSSGVSFTDKQIKQLVGARGLTGFTLKIYFVRMNGTGFSCAKGTSPRKRIVQKGHILTKEEMTQEEQAEMNVGTMINTYVQHPAIQAYRKNNRKNAEVKSPEEYVALARKYPDKPRSEITREGRKIHREEMTLEELEEVIIGTGLATHRNHPAVIAYMKENRRKGEEKSAEEYVALAKKYPTKPRSIIYKDGRKLSREEMTPEELEEVIIGTGLATHKDHPAVVAYMKENRLHAEIKSPEEYVTLARQYPGRPRQSIYKNGRKLAWKELTEEEKAEVQIASGLYNYRLQPVVKDYFHANRRIAESKTPQEYVMLARQYNSIPRALIYTHGKRLTWAEMSEEEKQESRIGQGLVRYRNHPAVQTYVQELRTQEQQKNSQQLYVELVNYIKEHNRYPSARGNSLYMNIYGRLRRFRSTLVDGKYQDPWLQKIYDLKNAVQNAPAGKFTFTPDGKGGYILEIEQPAVEKDITAPHKIEEQIPVGPSPHILRVHVDEQTKNLVLAVRDQAALERREFSGWLRSMHQKGNADQIVHAHTFDALHVLNRALFYDHRNHQIRPEVTYLLETVNNYVGILGEQEGTFYKLIYRGELEEDILPAADGFHVVAEQTGMSNQLPEAKRTMLLLEKARKQGTPYSVYLDGDNKTVWALGFQGKANTATAKADLETAIKFLLPPGYNVRMGLHELGIGVNKEGNITDLTKFRKGYVHIHLEQPAAEANDEGLATDISISLDIKAGRFAGEWDPKVRQFYSYSDQTIAENYRKLFDSFLDDEAKEKLDILSF